MTITLCVYVYLVKTSLRNSDVAVVDDCWISGFASMLSLFFKCLILRSRSSQLLA